MRIFITLMLACLTGFNPAPPQGLSGAWQRKEGNTIQTLIIADNYYALASYDTLGRKFLFTEGGACRVEGDMFAGETEFHSKDSTQVGGSFAASYRIQNGRFEWYHNGKDEVWDRVDDGKGPLAGNWHITGREQAGKMIEIKPAARKTIKIMSGTRFQWAAINSETGQFFGTGGGTYSFRDGRYTERIEFFSRDSSRVGMSLSFDGRIEGRNWHHSGKSSKGDPIHEIWSR